MCVRFLRWLVRGYQRFISPFLGDNCRFFPTCSAYMIEALRRHGAVKGLLLGTFRILRCNPLCKGGVDPVPPKGKWKNTPQDVQRYLAERERLHQMQDAQKR